MRQAAATALQITAPCRRRGASRVIGHRFAGLL